MGKYKLPKEFAENWVNSLRNPDFKQHFYSFKSLKYVNCYCSNGIAFISNGYVIEGENGVSNGKSFVDVWNGGAIIQRDLLKAIIDLNDLRRRPFAEIADWIESNVEFI